jgi:enamine deaminase RidA (YjgF/YER057c/UK114 family)
MNTRINISTGAKWESVVGFSRVVKTGSLVFVSGTVAVDGGSKVIEPNNYYEQTKFIIQKIEKALEQAGASLKDVVRTRMYVLDIEQWEEVARAHKEYFEDIKPVTSMVQISKLIADDLVVEIEADAVIQ